MTYETFLEVVEEMMVDGKVPTMRAVVTRTGGSYSMIQGFYRQWLQSLFADSRSGKRPLCFRRDDLVAWLRGRGGDSA